MCVNYYTLIFLLTLHWTYFSAALGSSLKRKKLVLLYSVVAIGWLQTAKKNIAMAVATLLSRLVGWLIEAGERQVCCVVLCSNKFEFWIKDTSLGGTHTQSYMLQER